MWGYQWLILESHFHIKTSFVPPVWYPWEDRWSCPRGSHSQAPFPWTKKHLPKIHNQREIFSGWKPFLLKVIWRKEAPVAKRLLLENAELVWHCRLFLTDKDSKQLLKLGHLSHKRLEHLTELDTGLDWTGTLQHNNKDAGLISTTELEKRKSDPTFLSFCLWRRNGLLAVIGTFLGEQT